MTKRFFAATIDSFIVMFLISFLFHNHINEIQEPFQEYIELLMNNSISFNEALNQIAQEAPALLKNLIILNLLSLLCFFCYYILLESIFSNASFGKRLFQLKVIDINTGSQMNLIQNLIRNFILFFILVLALPLIFVSKRLKYGDLAHDWLSQTRVVSNQHTSKTLVDPQAKDDDTNFTA